MRDRIELANLLRDGSPQIIFEEVDLFQVRSVVQTLRNRPNEPIVAQVQAREGRGQEPDRGGNASTGRRLFVVGPTHPGNDPVFADHSLPLALVHSLLGKERRGIRVAGTLQGKVHRQQGESLDHSPEIGTVQGNRRFGNLRLGGEPLDRQHVGERRGGKVNGKVPKQKALQRAHVVLRGSRAGTRRGRGRHRRSVRGSRAWSRTGTGRRRSRGCGRGTLRGSNGGFYRRGVRRHGTLTGRRTDRGGNGDIGVGHGQCGGGGGPLEIPSQQQHGRHGRHDSPHHKNKQENRPQPLIPIGWLVLLG
mmetsp:Transcript_17942/g.49710  ORF Transcript_17942/g.49710 Transcript_17942/m.49710 type:complete len:305 (-) Transcript_17942:526-1440(-)